MFDHLIDRLVVKVNPAKGIRKLRVNSDRVEAKVLTHEEVRRMLYMPKENKLKGLRDRAILHILFFTGGRISDVCNLKLKNFYEEQGFWLLDFVLKGGKRNRLAIHQECRIAIDRYLVESGHYDDPARPFFLTVRDNQKTQDENRKLSRQAVDELFKRYAKKVGIAGITPHSARATFIIQALENNCPI